MKKYIFISAILLICNIGFVNAYNPPYFDWVKNLPLNLFSSGLTISTTIDSQGNSYSAVVVTPPSYNVDGIPINTPNNQSNRGYIAKYDFNGNILWAFPLVNINFNSTPDQLLADNDGNVYFFGEFTDTYRAVSDPISYLGDSLLTQQLVPPSLPYKKGYFLAKLNSIGEIIWINNLAKDDATSSIASQTLSFDLQGNIQAMGMFRGYISSVSSDTLFTSEADKWEAYLTTYSPLGEVMDYRKLDGRSYIAGGPYTAPRLEKFKRDASGNIYRLSINSGPLEHKLKLFYKYNPQGDFLDSLTIKVSSSLEPVGISVEGFAVSPTGDAYIGGGFSGGLFIGDDFYINHFNYSHTTQHYQAFLFKLAAPDYQLDWVDTVIASPQSRSTNFKCLKIDELGNIYATGEYSVANLQRASFLRKFNESGEVLWEQNIAGLSTPEIPAVGYVETNRLELAQNGGNIWVSGRYRKNAYFAPGYHFTTIGDNYNNGFIAKYGLCNTPNPTIEVPSTTLLCGEDDSITLSAVLGNTNGSYFWSTPNGKAFIDNTNNTAELAVNQEGIYSLILQEDEECYGKSETIIIRKVSLPDVQIFASDSVVCVGSEVTLTASSAEEISWQDNVENGIPFILLDTQEFTVTVTDNNGCTNTASQLITALELPYNEVVKENNILTASETSQGTTYQWVDCQNNNLPISGATEQVFVPITNGEYAVIVTSQNNCSDTSSCYVINTLSIENNLLLDKQITLYPNPTSDKVSIQTDLDISTVYILDMQGKQLQVVNSKELDLSKLSSGIYLIKVKLKNNEIWNSKVIKN